MRAHLDDSLETDALHPLERPEELGADSWLAPGVALAILVGAPLLPSAPDVRDESPSWIWLERFERRLESLRPLTLGMDLIAERLDSRFCGAGAVTLLLDTSEELEAVRLRRAELLPELLHRLSRICERRLGGAGEVSDLTLGEVDQAEPRLSQVPLEILSNLRRLGSQPPETLLGSRIERHDPLLESASFLDRALELIAVRDSRLSLGGLHIFACLEFTLDIRQRGFFRDLGPRHGFDVWIDQSSQGGRRFCPVSGDGSRVDRLRTRGKPWRSVRVDGGDRNRLCVLLHTTEGELGLVLAGIEADEPDDQSLSDVEDVLGMLDPLVADLPFVQEPSRAREKRHERAEVAELVDHALYQHSGLVLFRKPLPWIGLKGIKRDLHPPVRVSLVENDRPY